MIKKNLILVVALLALCLQAVAAPIGREQARQKAQQFLQEKRTAVGMSALRHAPVKSGQETNEPFYVFNVGDDRGFVVVSGDDRTIPVLGYADSGTFDEEQIPDNMRVFLDEMARQITWLQQHSDANAMVVKPRQTVNHIAVAPMLVTQWNQDAPYNNKCPQSGDQRCVTGCVATAMAQLMYYHKYPEKTTTKISGYSSSGVTVPTYSANTVIDWDNMLPTYSGGETTTQKDAVALLMALCGASVKMDYSVDFSGAASQDVAPALMNYFDYDKAVRYVSRNDYKYQQWCDLICGELESGRPVYYAANSSGGGHAFVVDGFDGDEYFHVNWGWGGYYDNWFLLSVLDPGSNSGIGASTSTDGYTMGQEAVIGIQPQAGGEPIVTMWSNSISADKTSYSRTSATANFSVKVTHEIYNMTGATYTFDLGTGVYDNEGNTIYEGKFAQANFAYGWGNTYYHTIQFGANLPDGTYHIKGISRKANTSTWYPNQGSGSTLLTATLSGNKLTVQKPTISLTGTMTADDSTEAGKPVGLTATITNNGTVFNDDLYLFVDGEFVGGCHFEADAGETLELPLSFVPTTSGTKQVKLACITGYDNYWNPQYAYIAETSVNVAAAKTYNMTVTVTVTNATGTTVKGTTMKVKATYKNNSSYAYDNKLKIDLLKSIGGGYYDYVSTRDEWATIESKESKTMEVDFNNLEVGGKYTVIAYYSSGGSMKQGNNFPKTYTIEEAEEPEPDLETYVAYNDGTLTFYYDNKRSSRPGTTYDLPTVIGTTEEPGWYDYDNISKNVQKAVFDPSFASVRPKTTRDWFASCSALQEIQGIGYLNTSEVVNMESMFRGCKSLSSLDVSQFDTKNVTNMGGMFGECNVTTLDLSHFNTSNVTNMDQMFAECSSLDNLILGSQFVSDETTTVDNIFSFYGPCNLKTVTFTGDIPASINSSFFSGVGTEEAPATLDVPEEFRDNYKAQFNGDNFFGGHFKLGGIVVGDISGDGVVDVSDYIGIANYILGYPLAGFNEEAADVNGDGVIDVSDYIGVANLILYGNIYGK